MLDRKYFHYVFVAVMAFGMTTIMAFTTILVNEGFSHEFISQWLRSLPFGFIVAFPAALIINPLANIVATKVTSSDPKAGSNK